METLFRVVTREEAHRLIDDAPGTEIMVVTYNRWSGISDNGRFIRKRRGKKLVDKAKIVVLTESNPVMTLNLYGIFSNFSCSTDKSIMLSKIE